MNPTPFVPTNAWFTTRAVTTGLLIAALSLLVPTRGAAQRPTVGSIERLDPALDSLIARDARIEQLATGFQWSEGPVWRKQGGHLLFSDVPANTIYRWREREGIDVYMRPSGYAGPTPPGRELGTNGLTVDLQGRLVVADHGNRMIARVDESKFTKTVLARALEG